MPTVSVIIPAYNAAKYLGEAIESVLNQTFSDYELLVVDDGSTDETREIARRHGKRIRYIWQENGGPAKARNRGIKESTGRFVAFLDADDLWLPSKLEKQVRVFGQDPEVGMVFTENCCFDESGILQETLGKRQRLMKGDVARNIFLHSGVASPTVMVRREVFDKVGLFEEGLPMAEDDNMWIRIAAKYKVALIDEPLARIRLHSGSATVDRNRLYESVRANIALLTSRYQGVRERIEKAIPRKLSELQFELGYNHFANQKFGEARKAFFRGIRHYIWNWKNYAYLFLCLLPGSVNEKLRHLKRKIMSLTLD